MKHAWVILMLPLAALADPDLDPLVGEWVPTEGDCAEMRMVFDLEGQFVLQIAEDGRWRPLEVGTWRRQNSTIVTESEGRSERFDVESESTNRMVLVSRDVASDREAGVGTLDLRRCPTY